MAKGKYEEWLTPESLLLIEGWARDGLIEEQIAANMGIGYSTLQTWKVKYQDIQDALKSGKEVVDRQVENALLRSALGFEYEEEVATPRGEVVTVRKYEKPNTTAQIFWLKNRKPNEYREKQNIEHSGTITNQSIDLSSLSVEELKKLATLDE